MNVLWLGGGCGAGKTTTARRLAYRFDLRLYPVDAYAFAHEARATPDRHPTMSHAATLDFTARHVTPTVEQRVDSFLAYAKERADQLRLARDARLTVLMRDDATRLGLPVYEVDGSLSEDSTEDMVAQHFAEAIERGPRMRDGAERAAARRGENAVVNAQLAAFRAYLGENAPTQERPFTYACECTALGCAETVSLTPTQYRAANGAMAHA